MAFVFVIIPTKSIFKQSGDVEILNNGDALLVNEGIVLTTAAVDRYGVYTDGNNSIFCNGTIAANRTPVSLRNESKLTVGLSGTVSGNDYGVVASCDLSHVNTITNHGLISTASNGLSIYGAAGNIDVYNDGKIVSGGEVFVNYNGEAHISNSGIMKAGSFSAIRTGELADTIVNSGSITGRIQLNGGADTFNTLKGRVYGEIDGGAGNDRLYGSVAADKLTGGADSDTFYFATKLNSTLADHITDFTHGQDIIDVDNAFFRGVAASLLPAQFQDITHVAEQTDDRILYNRDKGALYYDADGAGGVKPVAFAILDNHAALTYKDFLVF